MELVTRILQVAFGLVTLAGGVVWFTALQAGDPIGQIVGVAFVGIGICFVLGTEVIRSQIRRMGTT